MSLSLSPLPRRLTAVFAAATLAVAAWAQQPERSYSPSDDTSEALQKYKAAIDAKNNAEALNVLAGILPKVAPDSYDAALVYMYRMQTYMGTGEYPKAIEPMEKTLELSEAKSPTYWDERVTKELNYYLVQLYFQEASQTKDAKLASTYLDKAEKYMNRWLAIVKGETNADAQLLYAQLLITRGLQNPDKPDLPLLKRALEQVEIGLKLATRPRDTFYVLKLVCLQQLERNAEAAELLELLVKQKPDSSTYWQQLAGIYLNLAAGQEGKSSGAVEAYNIRSIASIERAQANGFMNTPKDNFNLVGIYFNIAQYEKAAELLEAGLKNGKIDSDPKNWELLALSLQQLQRPLKAIDALKQATKAFPQSGQLEFQVAQIYISLDKQEEAITHLQSAITKGNLTRPYQVYLSLAFAAYSAQKYEVALEAARKAKEFPEGVRDGTNMEKALEDIIKDRETKKKAT